MSANLANDLRIVYDVANALAAVNAPASTNPLFSAVFVGGVGTDWERTVAYPYAVVRVESAEQPRGSVTRTVRVRIVSRVDDAVAPAKPELMDPTGRKLVLPGFRMLCMTVGQVREALASAQLGAPLESIATEYDAESQFPVQTADLVLAFTDAQAFGDAF